MPRYRVQRDQLNLGTSIEMKEHPTMSERLARRTARQQLQEHPNFYRMQPVINRILTKSERGIKPIPARRPVRRPPPQQDSGYFF